jgi:CubicO group peptidase (beta-lactamase class C family)
MVGMNEMTRIEERIAEFLESTKVPGVVAGVYRAGEQSIVAQGVANVATGAPMRPDTGFLFGSITKIMTTMLVLQQVERGTLDLDTPVVVYLPEFRLATAGAAEKILVRHLVTHTSGIDADLFFPEGKGDGALRVYLEGLGRGCGTLFEPGEYVSYSNGAMMVAGRLLEVVTGLPYHRLLKREVFAGVGMADSCASAEEAILRGTAVGHFFDQATGGVRRTDMFMLPDTWAPAGATPIGTVGDLLALGRVHLEEGLSPSGTRVLSAESARAMRTVTGNLGTPNVPPVGMGWLLMEFGGTTVLSMSGASPGGVAILAVAPEQDLVVAAFGNDPRVLSLHNELVPLLAGDDSAQPLVPQEVDLAPFAGTYRSNQLRVEVGVVDGQLEERVTYQPADASQESIFSRFAGGAFSEIPPQRYVPVGGNVFAPAGVPLEALTGYNRQILVSYHGMGDDGPTHRCAGGRMTLKQ